MENIFTVHEAAVYLRCSDWTVYQLCKSKQLSHFKIGNSIRITQSDIENYINKSRNINKY